MSHLARILAAVALLAWPAAALADIPPPEDRPPAPAPADQSAPAADAPPIPAAPRPPEATPVTDPSVPPDVIAVEESSGPNMGLIAGVIVVLTVAAGAGYWFANRNRA